MYVRKLYRRSVVITTNAVKTTNVPPVVHNEANVISNQSLQLRNKEFKNTCQQSPSQQCYAGPMRALQWPRMG